MVDTTAPRYHNGKLKSDYNSPWQPGCADIIFPYCYFVDILSAVGGTMGLLTGFSIISGVEILYFCVKMIIGCISRECKKKDICDLQYNKNHKRINAVVHL